MKKLIAILLLSSATIAQAQSINGRAAAIGLIAGIVTYNVVRSQEINHANSCQPVRQVQNGTLIDCLGNVYYQSYSGHTVPVHTMIGVNDYTQYDQKLREYAIMSARQNLYNNYGIR